MNPILWTPTPEAVAAANLTRFRALARTCGGPADDSYPSLHRWSLADRGAFWSAVWDFGGVIGEKGDAKTSPSKAFAPGSHMTDTVWFPGSSLNFAENLLRPGLDPDSVAIAFRSEAGDRRTLTRGELFRQATAFATFLRNQGVTPGGPRRGLVLVLAGLRRRRRRRPLRADRTGGPRHDGGGELRREAHRGRGPGAGRAAATAERADGRRGR